MTTEDIPRRLVAALEALRHLGLGRNPLRTVGISPPQLALLDWIARHPATRLREVAAGLGVSSPTASVALRRLEELGLVVRRPDPRDRRAVRFSLTPQGTALHREAERFRRLQAEGILAGLDPEEREELVRLLEKAVAAMESRKEAGS